MAKHLFSPTMLGNTKLENRFCLLAHRTHFGRGGRLSDRHIAYYRRRAQGGCGLIILGELTLHENDWPWESLIDLREPAAIQDLARLADAVRESGTRLFAQLTHRGFQSSGQISRQATWGPSAMADVVFGETCKPMEPEDMAELAESFARAARLVRESGFDGLEIDMGPESLLRQFLSPISNHRSDEYGGSLENRMRLPLEIVAAVRDAVGPDFTLGVCLTADEMFWGGITPEESVPTAQALETSGQIDFLNVAVGTYYNLHMVMPSQHVPSGLSVETARTVKQGIDLPVIAGHHIDFPEMAEDLIACGKADLAGLVRPLICDPDLPRKIRRGKLSDIRPCIRDNKGCVGRLNQSKALGCIHNPEVGKESLEGSNASLNGKPPFIASRKKKVLVVGAGPSGLEAARAAAERGHEVSVYEREADAGGQVVLIGKRPGREAVPALIHYLRNRLDALGVPVHTGVDVTPELILDKHPDAVVVATGSRPSPTPYPGDYGSPLVISGRDAVQETAPVGGHVLFIDEDGGHHAMATAELLAGRGKKVDIITSDLFVGIELAPRGELYLGRQRLLQQGVTFTTDVEVTEINGKRVTARDIYTNDPIVFDDHDTVVLDVGNAARDGLYKQIKGRIREVYRTGDCVAPRGIDMAIIEARNVGELL